MAMYFEMSVECGREQEAAKAIAQHFDKLQLSLSDGFTTTCWASTPRNASEYENMSEGWAGDDAWWCVVAVRGASYAAFAPVEREDGTTEYVHDERLVSSSQQINEISLLLYSHLRQAPPYPYRYALVGYETEFFRMFDELLSPEEMALYGPESSTPVNWDGLVLAEEVWKAKGEPEGFVPFENGYLWKPYKDINQL